MYSLVIRYAIIIFNIYLIIMLKYIIVMVPDIFGKCGCFNSHSLIISTLFLPTLETSCSSFILTTCLETDGIIVFKRLAQKCWILFSCDRLNTLVYLLRIIISTSSWACIILWWIYLSNLYVRVFAFLLWNEYQDYIIFTYIYILYYYNIHMIS